MYHVPMKPNGCIIVCAVHLDLVSVLFYAIPVSTFLKFTCHLFKSHTLLSVLSVTSLLLFGLVTGFTVGVESLVDWLCSTDSIVGSLVSVNSSLGSRVPSIGSQMLCDLYSYG